MSASWRRRETGAEVHELVCARGCVEGGDIGWREGKRSEEGGPRLTRARPAVVVGGSVVAVRVGHGTQVVAEWNAGSHERKDGEAGGQDGGVVTGQDRMQCDADR